jgi:hypothetical protein
MRLVQIFLLLASFLSQAQNFTSSLPIVKVTSSQTIVDEPRVAGQMRVINNSTTVNSSSDTVYALNTNIDIELRGNSSLEFDKKSYTVILKSNDGSPKSDSILTMPEGNEWVLHAMYIHKSMIRIPLTHILFEKMGHYAPRGHYVELIVNGDYKGIYWFMEKVTVNPDRTNINEFSNDITGGYMLRIDWEGKAGSFSSNYDSQGGQKMKLQYHYPKGSVLTPEHKSYLKNSVTNFEDALFSENFRSFQNIRYDDYIDINSFSDFMLINELSKNSDGYKLSSYIHKNSDLVDPKWKAGPIWDFDQTYGLSLVCSCNDTCGWTFMQSQAGCEDLFSMPMWWQNFTRDSIYTNLLEQKWSTYRSSFLEDQQLLGLIDSLQNEISGALDRNFSRWNLLGESVWEYPQDPAFSSYEEEISYLKKWTVDRMDWMDTNIEYIQEWSSAKNNVAVYPNPATNLVKIVVAPGDEIIIVDASGRLLYHESDCSNSLIILRLEDWSEGVYTIFQRNKNGVNSGKLVVER